MRKVTIKHVGAFALLFVLLLTGFAGKEASPPPLLCSHQNGGIECTDNLLGTGVSASTMFSVDPSGPFGYLLAGDLSPLGIAKVFTGSYQTNPSADTVCLAGVADNNLRYMRTAGSEEFGFMTNNEAGLLTLAQATGGFPHSHIDYKPDEMNIRQAITPTGPRSGICFSGGSIYVRAERGGGFYLPPRSNVQRDSILSPGEGLILWNTDLKRLQIFDGSNWKTLKFE